MKSILISIRPEWCAKIASGEKTIEIRKTKPNCEKQFKSAEMWLKLNDNKVLNPLTVNASLPLEHSSRQTWYAYINIHGKRIHLGRYSKKSDAIKARKVAEDEYFAPILEEVHKNE